MTKIVQKFNATTGRKMNLGILVGETVAFYIYAADGETKKIAKARASLVVREG